jgi:brefeldin A-inhibited guanine nucleotide-exchange protein
MIRDAFVTSLTKFTHLHAPASMQPKHVEAIKVLAAVAEEDGNNLQDSWVHVLKCVSR